MHELVGVLAGMASNGLGGTAVAVTRYAIGAIDPITLGAFRFGIGFVFFLPVAIMQGESGRHRPTGGARWGCRCHVKMSAV